MNEVEHVFVHCNAQTVTTGIVTRGAGLMEGQLEPAETKEDVRGGGKFEGQNTVKIEVERKGLPPVSPLRKFLTKGTI